MRRAHFFIFYFTLFILAAPSYGAEPPAMSEGDPILGIWLPKEQEAAVQLYACENRICGRFVWLKENSAEMPSLDDKNPDPDQRERRLCGLTFMGGFNANGTGDYTDGWLYSPRHGSMFSASLTLTSKETLELRGYVLVPLLGGSQEWNRYNGQIKMTPCA